MSLQLIAKQMEAKGRDGDSVLVHMTPGEVEGLQKLAESAGGTLTVNPETGLVEANFLKKLISSPFFAPLAGAGLMMVPGVGPMMAAGLVGGGTALATGDVGKGAMAGLGAYGGAGLAGGLMGAGNAAASQAATAANPAVMGPMPGAASNFEAAKAGVSALGNEAGRSAFMQGVGGVGGLAKSVGMAAAPMLTQEQKTAEAPVDDEMYSYTFDPGRTGAERTPTSSSAEREYFRSSYSPVRKVRASEYPVYAAQGGLMGLAEGGETAAPSQGMTGGSAAAFDYLMGAAPSSSAGLPAMAAQAPAAQMTAPAGNQMYAFNPATGTFTRNPNYVDPMAKPAVEPVPFIGGGGGGGEGGGSDGRANNEYFGNEGGYAADRGMGSEVYGDMPAGTYAGGGLLGLAKGGMASGGFVVPADVVSALGNGSTDAGLRIIKAMLGKVKPIRGRGDGLSDSIPTNIDGKQPARVADGEAYIDPETVKRIGGAKKLYAMMDKIRAQAHGKTSQQRKVNPAKVLA